MPSHPKPWDVGRAKPKARPFQRVLVICEDTKSALDYLSHFPFDRDVVIVEHVGTGMNTDSLMTEAIRRVQLAQREKKPYSRVWVVFDKDDFPDENFNRAFELASSNPLIEVCWSNECFELWYLLHFAYLDCGLGRSTIFQKLNEQLGERYDKADKEVYGKLINRLPDALRNADKLYQRNVGPARRANPSTRVHHLVRFLQQLSPEQGHGSGG